MSNPSPVTLFVIYTGGAVVRFDRDYYRQRHLPLVIDAWGRAAA